MDSRGSGGNDPESGGYHHRNATSEQSCGNKNGQQNHLPMSRKIFMPRTVYFIAFASACFLLYLITSYPNQFYLPTSNNHASKLSKSNEPSLPSDIGNLSAPTDEFFQINSTPVSKNSSSSVYAPGHDNFLLENYTPGSNNTTPMYSPADESLQAPTAGFIEGNSSPVLNHSSPYAPTDDFLRGNSSPVSNTSSSMYPPEKLAMPVNQEPEEAKLEKMLSEAAMDDKTVIVTTVNAAWAAPNSLFDLFLESFKIGNETQKLLNHLVVIALDQKGFSRCLELHPRCVALTTERFDFSGEQLFMTGDYVNLVWRKVEFVHTVLQMGYNVIFTDADIMWFRDPFLHFLEDADMQTASDHYFGTPTEGIANTGFYYVKSNSRTVQFYKFWLASRDKNPPENDQEVFNRIMFDPSMEQSGIKIRLLSTAFYGGLCEPVDNLNLTCTMHANCCIGTDRKLHDLNMLIEDWKRYMALPNEEKATTPQTWTVPRLCG